MIEDFQNIYAHMGDELSKTIYMDRVNYSITQNCRYLEEMVDRSVRSRDEWRDFCQYLTEKSQSCDMYLFGAGVWGRTLYNETKKFIPWKGVIDNQPAGKVMEMLDVMSLEQFADCCGRNAAVVISSYKNRADMLAQLEKEGFPADKIIDGGSIIYQLTEGAIYFDLEELKPREPYEVFVDAGAFDGLTTKEFLKWCGGNGYSYCFEADVSNIDMIRNQMSGDTNCEIIPKALWSETTVLSMRMTGNYASSVTENREGDDVQEIQAVALDDFAKGKAVTFIKMDIEGAELAALRGAKQVIMGRHPKLAISIYHKAEDIWTIPQLLLDYYPGYKFYIRHYSFAGYDTVLYAVP